MRARGTRFGQIGKPVPETEPRRDTLRTQKLPPAPGPEAWTRAPSSLLPRTPQPCEVVPTPKDIDQLESSTRATTKPTPGHTPACSTPWTRTRASCTDGDSQPERETPSPPPPITPPSVQLPTPGSGGPSPTCSASAPNATLPSPCHTEPEFAENFAASLPWTANVARFSRASPRTSPPAERPGLPGSAPKFGKTPARPGYAPGPTPTDGSAPGCPARGQRAVGLSSLNISAPVISVDAARQDLRRLTSAPAPDGSAG